MSVQSDSRQCAVIMVGEEEEEKAGEALPKA
jgi:hypothetical protein